MMNASPYFRIPSAPCGGTHRQLWMDSMTLLVTGATAPRRNQGATKVGASPRAGESAAPQAGSIQ